MSNSNIYLQDVATRHQIFVQRYAGGLVNKIEDNLNDLQKELIDIVSVKDLTRLSYPNRLKLIKILKEVYGVRISEIRDLVMNELTDFTSYEAQFAFNSLTAAIATTTALSLPSDTQIKAILEGKYLESKPGNRTLTIKKAFDNFTTSKGKQIGNLVVEAVSQGLTTQQAINKMKIQDKKVRREAETLIRTSTNAISNEARRLTYNSNSKFMKGLKYIATLDTRTTIICGSRDGKIYPVKSAPALPAHWGCRSTYSVQVKDEYSLKDKDARTYRPSKSGPVDSRKTYSGWLKEQPDKVVYEILGEKRGKLFKSGKVKLDRFLDDKNEILNLKELSEKESLTLE